MSCFQSGVCLLKLTLKNVLGFAEKVIGKVKSITLESKQKISLALKHFEFKKSEDEPIFKYTSAVLSRKFPYETDGLILTPINDPYLGGSTSVYKWKPPEHTNN